MAMNLGTANLKLVNKSQPQLVHSSSQHSITASDHYYSVSENSNSDGDATVIRYHTPVDPPSNHQPAAYRSLTPDPSSDKSPATTAFLASPQSAESPLRPVRLPSPDHRPLLDKPLPGAYPESSTQLATQQLAEFQRTRPTGSDHYSPSPSPSPPSAQTPHRVFKVSQAAESAELEPSRSITSNEERPPGSHYAAEIAHESVSSDEMGNWRGSRVVRPNTPGVDDTPYIHFAIDQLTRDEETLGHSRDRTGSPDMTPPRPGPSVSPLSHREEEAAMAGEYHTIRTPEPIQKGYNRSPSISSLSEEHEPIQQHDEIQPTEPLPQPQPQPAAITSPHPPKDMFKYPPLNFVPKSLSLLSFLAIFVVCAIFIALCTFSVIWSSKKQGLWSYDGIGTSHYFLAEYLPQLLAVLLLIYLIHMQQALQRILPFVLLAQPNKHNGDTFGTVPLYITNYLLPNMSLIRSRRLVLQYAAISFWLMLFTVPLASSLYQARFYGGSIGWRWATTQPVGIILIGLYTNLVFMTFALTMWLRRGPTGLKWDPVSLADVLVLLRKSTLINSDSPMQELYRPERGSLGYWQSSSNPGDFYHGIGLQQTTRLQIEKGKAVIHAEQGPPHVSTFESWRTTKHFSLRPRYIHESYMALYALVFLILLVAFLVASYINSALQRGFSPLLETATSATSSFISFSPSNFLYSFIPALVAMLQPLLWASIDTAARFLAPYIALIRAGPRGVPAEASVLLSYSADSPFIAPLRALGYGHAAIAGSAGLGLLSWALPVIGGGIFTAQFVNASDGGEIVIRADPAGLGALTAFVALCAFGWIAAWPVTRIALHGRLAGRKRSGNRGEESEKLAGEGRATSLEEWLADTDVRYLAGVREAVGDSILSSRVWREPRTREDLVGRLVGRGRGRWSWDGSQGSGVQRMDV